MAMSANDHEEEPAATDDVAEAGRGSDSGTINPRLSDVFDLTIRQDEVSFVIPHLKEDLPLSIDPFLLWKSESVEYAALHEILLSFVEKVRSESVGGGETRARLLLSEVAEPVELGLGYAAGTKRGSALGPALRAAITDTFRDTPQLNAGGINHIELLALLVPKIAEDRISDITASVLKKWLTDYSGQQARQLGIPTRSFRMVGWDGDRLDWIPFTCQLPYNPVDGSPIILCPLDLLRRLPWINYVDYYRSTYAPLVLPPGRSRKAVPKESVLAYNRAHYDTVQTYVASREANASLCTPDPLFTPLRFTTLQRKLAELRKLPTGKTGGADKQFEDLAFDLLSSLLYPELDLAADQVRTISGAHIRDVIFHNDRKTAFLGDLRDQYGARQIVVELKNVRSLETEHVNQLYRYLDDEEIGKFGILLARNPMPRNVAQNIVDLHSSKRAAVLCLDDSDLELMLQLMESGRRPIEAIRKKYVEFTRTLPK
ncbi:hypothetical protein H8N01_29620 [Streptomyces sp. AC536]|uniref:hypothetical protein n=1 Tax=Streptomyces buecherae TaxID=2763006 RepID=UPI00164CDF68|nr:hypothetical protein [Streptomyces buecherae]MBC3986628.1 hypothetical protein [Streptomyces buecherae]QNJ40064.1 hypothetical protein H7H31_09390 [Streptomyces buecherae]